MDLGLDTAARERDVRKLDELYIVNGIDELMNWQKEELLGFINQLNSSCLKASGDGTRVNLSVLSPYLVRRIKLYIENAIQYNSFFL